MTELLRALAPTIVGIDEDLIDRARALDKLYTATRYPNGLPSGAPADYYTRGEAERAIAALQAGARALVDAVPDVREVRLFGSLARGDATPHSDADLWILLRTAARSFVDRGAELSRFFEGAGIGCDVLAYTEAEWEELRSAGRRLAAVVESEGIVLARRAEA